MTVILSYSLTGWASNRLPSSFAIFSTPSSDRPCRLEELVVITSQVGNEYQDTGRDVEAHILPLMREHRIRYVQVARKGHLEAEGITVLDDSRHHGIR
jgi:hypothetical protein